MNEHVSWFNRSLWSVNHEADPVLGVSIHAMYFISDTFISGAQAPKWTHEKIGSRPYRPGAIRCGRHWAALFPSILWSKFPWAGNHSWGGTAGVWGTPRPNPSVSADSRPAFRRTSCRSPLGSGTQQSRVSDADMRCLDTGMWRAGYVPRQGLGRTVAWSGFRSRGCSSCKGRWHAVGKAGCSGFWILIHLIFIASPWTGTIIILSDRWGNWGTEGLSNFAQGHTTINEGQLPVCVLTISHHSLFLETHVRITSLWTAACGWEKNGPQRTSRTTGGVCFIVLTLI